MFQKKNAKVTMPLFHISQKLSFARCGERTMQESYTCMPDQHIVRISKKLQNVEISSVKSKNDQVPQHKRK